jgi:hypothetical protein
VLAWNGTAWAPAAPAAGGNAFTLPYSGTQSSAANLLNIENTGTGRAANFTGGAGTGVRGATAGAGTGVDAFASTASGTALRAGNASVSGTALEITKGSIRVAGAGKDTPTAAFWTELACWAQYIDNPHSNNNPDAIILATYVEKNQSVKTYIWIGYDAAAGKWMIKTDNKQDGFCTVQRVNILIIRP